MTLNLPQHSEKVKQLLTKLDEDRLAILHLAAGGLTPALSSMFELDILAFGAAKRAISAISAVKLLVESWNLVTTRTLLRTHIDTALRFSAAWLVDEPNEFARKIIAGERLDKIKDRNGNQMRDAYLVETMAAERPWLPEVYSQLSGFVHFSGSHVFASIASVDDDGTVSIHLTESDLHYPEESWVEAIACFHETTEILVNHLQSYVQSKNLHD